MLNFEKINLSNLLELKDYLYFPDKLGCDYSLEVIYSWTNKLDTQVAFYNDDAFLKSYYVKENFCYFLPFKEKFKNLQYLFNDFLYNSKDTTFELCNLTLEEAEELKKILPYSHFYFDRTWSDYVYLTKDLAEFKGNKYASKRHHVKRFEKLYPNVFLKEASLEDIPKIKEFFKEFEKEKSVFKGEASFEEASSYNLIDVYDKLGLRCFILMDGTKIIGLTILELKKGIIYDHVEKCLRSYEGIYPFLVNKIAKMFVNEYKYINREDDSGDEGLRYSKTEYHPSFMVDKFLFIVDNNLSLLDKIPTLKINEDLCVKELDEKDKEEYAKLNKDEERNKYWGYDYTLDLKDGEIPNGDYFYNGVLKDIKEKNSYVFAIYYKNKLAGEVVAYNLAYSNSCEIGYRLFENYEGKNLAFLSTKKVLDFLKNTVKLNNFFIKSYIENEKSLSLIKRLNASFLYEDSVFKYFEI